MASAEKHTLGGSDKGDLQVSSLWVLLGLTESLLSGLSLKVLKKKLRSLFRVQPGLLNFWGREWNGLRLGAMGSPLFWGEGAPEYTFRVGTSP